MASQKSSPHVPKFGVPKFGNWDGENVPYTACFENARKEKTGGGSVRMNPNDPEENPGAFMLSGSFKNSNGSSNNRSSSAPSHHRRRPDNGSEDRSYHSNKSISVPKFGAWDENDPASAAGFTVIFDKVKEEKQVASSRVPYAPSESEIENEPQEKYRKRSPSKMRCCFF